MSKILIHIGYPKAGSTFLQNYFSVHPEISYDGGFTDNYKSTGSVGSINIQTSAQDKITVLSEEQLSVWPGKLTKIGAQYTLSDIQDQQMRTCIDLKKKFPDAKILIVTRGFYSVIKSLYSQYISVGGIDDFNTFLNKNINNLTLQFNYDYLINVYIKFFGKDNLMILPYELLVDDQLRFLEFVNSICEVGPIPFHAGRINMSKTDEELNCYRYLSVLVYSCLKIFPDVISEKMYANYTRLLYSNKFKFLTLLSSKKRLQMQQSGYTNHFRNLANFAKNMELYRPYLKHYLTS